LSKRRLQINTAFVVSLFLTGCGFFDAKQTEPTCKISPKPSRETYFESFDDKYGGGWVRGRRWPMTIWDGVAYSYSPWWLDANHAPPGAGYLHLVLWTLTSSRIEKEPVIFPGYPGSKFIARNQSTDLTNAKLTVRLRGEVDMQGSQMLVLVQAENKNNVRANYVLTGHPFKITPEWSEQTVTLSPDPNQWLCLGSRYDLTKTYDCYDVAEVLADVNVDIIFVLFPIQMVPVEDIVEPHKLFAGRDFHVAQEFLPKGIVMFDWVRIEYPQ